MEWITAEHVAQLALLVGAVGTFLKIVWDMAMGRIDALNKRVDKLEHQLDQEIRYRIRLMAYVGELQRIMRAAGLMVPPEPVLEDEPEK